MQSHIRVFAGILAPLLILPFVAWLSAAEAADATPTVTPWADLIDPDALDFDDPFREMDSDTLSYLRTYAKASERLQSDAMLPEARIRLQSRLEEATLALSARGLDPDQLLSQRWIVAEHRRAAAITGNPDLNGQVVTLSGYYIPWIQAVDGSSVGYLVSQPGMCSHLPAPPPNQLVRLVLPAGIDQAKLYDKVNIRGTLSLRKTTQSVFVIDGNAQLRSAWTLSVDRMHSEPAAPDKLAPWAHWPPWAHRLNRQRQNPRAQAPDAAVD